MTISKEFKVGLLTLISGTILYFGFRFLKGFDLFSKTAYYYAVYPQIDGLQASNPVMVNGFPVGRVSIISIMQDRGNQMLVTLEIDKTLQLGKNSQAVLTDNGLLGGKMIELKLSAEGGLLQEGDTLASERAIPMMTSLQEKATPLMGSVDSIMTNLNTMLKGYAALTGDVQRLVGNAANASGRVDGMLAGNQQEIASMMKNFNKLSASLLQMQQKMDPILNNLSQVSDSLAKVEVAAMAKEMQLTLAEMRKTMTAINNGEGSMGKVMKDEALYANMNKTMQDLDSLFIDMKEHPKRYVHFSVFGKKEGKEEKK
jgi:phospholipid/cholesterol/gamma-HCH transport system substrate-binding protein